MPYDTSTIPHVQEKRSGLVDRREYPSLPPLDERAAQMLVGGSTMEGAAGTGAVILAILGLVGIVPLYMAPIAAICIGAALLFQWGMVAWRLSRIARQTGGTVMKRTGYGAGSTVEFMGGAAGIVLGVLALLGQVPMILVGASAVVFGGALLVGGSTINSLRALRTSPWFAGRMAYVADQSIAAVAGTQLFAGVGAGALGILALMGIAPVILNLTAMLVLGCAILFSGTTIGAKANSLLFG
ncbi:MAG: hypothetical protein AB1515_10085 [Nitrospirota bacterium]